MTTDEKIDSIELRLGKIEKLVGQIKNLAIGIAIGMIVAALVFGVITLQEAKEVIKTIK
jgi:tetrahydromethanopterin S-methyltransferase subunit B